MQTIDAMRDELAAITKRGIGMPVAGMVYWIAMAALGSQLEPRQAALAMFFGTGAVFPLGMYTVCTVRLSQAVDAPYLLAIPQVFVFVALGAWAVTLLGWASSVLRRAGEAPS